MHLAQIWDIQGRSKVTMFLRLKGSPYLRSDGSYTPLSPATDSSDTAEVTPIFFGPAPVPRCWGVESKDNRGRKVR